MIFLQTVLHIIQDQALHSEITNTKPCFLCLHHHHHQKHKTQTLGTLMSHLCKTELTPVQWKTIIHYCSPTGSIDQLQILSKKFIPTMLPQCFNNIVQIQKRFSVLPQKPLHGCGKDDKLERTWRLFLIFFVLLTLNLCSKSSLSSTDIFFALLLMLFFIFLLFL